MAGVISTRGLSETDSLGAWLLVEFVVADDELTFGGVAR
jgi:hypothetical protein